MTAGKIPLRARRGHSLVRLLLALALIASGCSSEELLSVEGGLDFEVLGDTETGDPVASDPTGAVATDIEADFAALWAEVDGQPTGPLDGRIGVVVNVGFLYRNPTVVSISGTDAWLVNVSSNRRGECNLADVVRSPWSLSQLKRSYRPKRSR